MEITESLFVVADELTEEGELFRFDTGDQTLYFNVDGTDASEVAVTTVQAGVTLHASDLLVV
ncbi:hypothetical protein [Bradyrhizobium sp. OAE829]|uniref:hypothetical protein n=1 Tax=Bradyrhizobium sp. OAE829 TaxID=2663807 RepID=UPI00178ACEA6